MHAPPVEAFEQRLQLCRCQSNDTVGDGGPLELAVFQPLREQADTRPIEVNQLDPVSAPRPEHIDRARERIGAHALANQRGQTLRALAEVDRLRRYHDADRAGRADHDPAFNAPSTAAIVAGEAPFSIVTLTPATSISMVAARRCRVRRFERNVGAGRFGAKASSGVATAGTNGSYVRSAPAGTPVDFSRRHKFDHVSIRTIHPGPHRIEIQANGRILGTTLVQVTEPATPERAE